MTQPARHPVSVHCRTHGFADDQSDPRTRRPPALASAPDVHDDVGLPRANSVLHRRVKLRRPPHAVACGQHRRKTRRCDQADSARRPLRRRLDTIERPARVRMRNRKPCTRARRRLFGWKVRLPLATTFSSLCLAFPSGRPDASLVYGSIGGNLAAGRRGPQGGPGSQPHRRLSGDCLRVLTVLRLVKPGLPQRTRSISGQNLARRDRSRRSPPPASSRIGPSRP